MKAQTAGIIMGFLRLYLAVCVVVVHAGSPVFPWTIHDGHEAVQIFFMISGFYMSLVASKYHSARQFYTSRFLRIFIPYWITLAVVILLSVGSGILSGNWLELNPYLTQPLEKNGFGGLAFTTLSNLTIFFQDWVMFLRHDIGQALTFTSNFRESASPLFPYLLIPQAWSVGLEVVFYLCFPFLNKLKSKFLVLILIISLLARVFTYQVLNLSHDPWNYRFFPFELGLFVAGMLSYRLYSSASPKDISYTVKNALIYFLLCLALFGVFVGVKFLSTFASRYIDANYARLMLYPAWALIIPVLFHFFKTSKLDRFVGELSYPVYLIHLIVIALLRNIIEMFGLPAGLLGIWSVIISVLWSAVFYLLVIRRLDEARLKITFGQV